MKNFAQTRIVLTPLGRRPWYRNVNWILPAAALFGIGVVAFIIWCAEKAVN